MRLIRRFPRSHVLSRTRTQAYARQSITVDVDDSFGKGLRGFLRHIVTDALEDAVRIFAREVLGIGCSVRGRTVEITGNGDCGHSDNGSCEEFLFQIVVSWLAFSQAQPPAIIVDDDAD